MLRFHSQALSDINPILQWETLQANKPSQICHLTDWMSVPRSRCLQMGWPRSWGRNKANEAASFMPPRPSSFMPTTPLSSTLIIPISFSTFNLIHTYPAGPLLISHAHVITLHGNGQHLFNLLLNLSYVHATAPSHRPLHLSFLIWPPPSTYSFHIHHIPITPTSIPIFLFSNIH